jgi:helicase-like protein/SNF2 domain-containing protein
MDTEAGGLRGIRWRLSYRTSTLRPDNRPVDILHDFYIPALQRSVHYDRVAGYFRSTSLAAASQGFSTFVGRRGQMRLIVGADLDPDDVHAILQGDEARLTTLLNAELEQTDHWPEGVRHGVELLAWMVAHGHLEVQVAFRVHTGTGEPLAVDSLADGYVHMKWAIFTDAQGDRLYASGSLNESRTALSLNAENIDVHCDWQGEDARRRVEEAAQEFEILWQNQHPAFRVLTLPEAVRQRLISLAARVTQPTEIDGSSAAPCTVPPPSAVERLRFALLRDGPQLPGGRYVGLETAPITPWPHQTIVARRLIATWPYSYLLCDEVGLGKTIEAGLAIRSLYLSGLAKRVLICAPASLTRQWQREMASKFFLPFGRALSGSPARHEYLLPVSEERPSPSVYSPDLVIVSTGLVERRDRRSDLERMPAVDVALVDEAHYARRKNPTAGSRAAPEYGYLYTAIQESLRPRSRSLWLATATPMQLDAVEVADLLALTRRVGAFQDDPSLMQAYYEILGRLTGGRSPSASAWEFLRRAVMAVETDDPALWSFLQGTVIDGRIRLTVNRWLEHDRPPRPADLPGVRRLLFAASPLSRVMLRHKRPLLEIYREYGQLQGNLAHRHLLPLPRIVFTAQERQAYEQLEAYCRGLAAQMARHGTPQSRSAMGFLLSFLRLRFASSLFAIRETVRRRLERVEATLAGVMLTNTPENDAERLTEVLDEDEDDRDVAIALLKNRTPEDLQWEALQLRGLRRTLGDLSGPASKMTELLRILEQRRIRDTGRFQQTVIFTRFYDTLCDLVNRLQRAAPEALIGTYSGQGGQYWDEVARHMIGVERDEIKHRFLRGEIDILICTDAAAEGLNLQSADLLVNFDLPWNPMKVEQRIGRIDRIGQRHRDIHVLNLCYADSAEEIVYGRLLARLHDAGIIVGTQQMSLLPVTPDEFAKLADKTLSAETLQRQAMERAHEARQRTDSMEMSPEELYQIYERLAEQANQTPAPVDLEAIWQTLRNSIYLQQLGCRGYGEAHEQVMTLTNIPRVVDGTAMTASRTTFDVGLPTFEGRLHFATYGDPAFEAVLQHIEAFPLPECVQRLEVGVPEIPVTVVGYAVAERNSEDQPCYRLVTTWHDLATLQLDVSRSLSEAEVEPLRQRLSARARQEFAITQAVPWIEALNERAGHSQLLLGYLVAHGLLQSRLQTGAAEALFWREMQALEAICQGRDSLRVRHIPTTLGRRLAGLLFDLDLPSIGGEGYIDAPQPLLHAFIEAVCRVANGLKRRRADLATAEVISRLEREIDRLGSQLSGDTSGVYSRS